MANSNNNNNNVSLDLKSVNRLVNAAKKVSKHSSSSAKQLNSLINNNAIMLAGSDTDSTILKQCTVSVQRLNPQQFPPIGVNDLRNKLKKTREIKSSQTNATVKTQNQAPTKVPIQPSIKLTIKREPKQNCNYRVTSLQDVRSITSESENRLLEDDGELSVATGSIDEEQLLQDEDENRKEHTRIVESKSDGKETNDSDFYETMSIAANYDIDEIDEPKNRVPKSLPNIEQSSLEKVSNWRENVHSVKVKRRKRSLNIPKKTVTKGLKTLKKNPNSNQQLTLSNPSSNGFPQLPMHNRNNSESRNNASSAFTLPHPRGNKDGVRNFSPGQSGICFRYRNTGVCPRKECKFLHLGRETYNTEHIPRLLSEDRQAITDYDMLKKMSEQNRIGQVGKIEQLNKNPLPVNINNTLNNIDFRSVSVARCEDKRDDKNLPSNINKIQESHKFPMEKIFQGAPDKRILLGIPPPPGRLDKQTSQNHSQHHDNSNYNRTQNSQSSVFSYPSTSHNTQNIHPPSHNSQNIHPPNHNTQNIHPPSHNTQKIHPPIPRSDYFSMSRTQQENRSHSLRLQQFPRTSDMPPPEKMRMMTKSEEPDFSKKSFEELNHKFETEDLDIETEWMIVNSMNTKLKQHHPPEKVDIHRKVIEQALFKIHKKIEKEWKSSYLEIARKLLNFKYELQCVKREDLFILAECESKGQYFSNVVKTLQNMHDLDYTICGIDKERDHIQLFYDSIERNGMILQFWKDFRQDVIRSSKTMEKLLSTVQLTRLNACFEESDIHGLFEYFKTKKDFKLLNNASKTTFLAVFYRFSKTNELFEYLELYIDSIHDIPKEVIRMVLSQSPTMPDILKAYNLLKKMLKIVSREIWSEFKAEWNQLLIYCCRRGDDSASIQTVEQFYGIMHECKVIPTIECALFMLSGFCKTGYFEIFETRYQGFLQLKVFPPDYHYPDDFAQAIGDNIVNYSRDDKNCLHHMVSILLSSDHPPPEALINEVLGMLVSKRRFSEVFKLVTKCFSCSIILSQQELRRVVYALEEWMQNVDASVRVYEQMRKFYPRPEHQCICGGNVKPQNITNRILSAPGELSSPKSSVSSQDGKVTEIEAVATTSNTKHVSAVIIPDKDKDALMFAAELSAAVEDVKRFTDIFDKSREAKLGKNDKILTGLFLGITGHSDPSSFFQTFVLDLFARNDGELLGVEDTLGRAGVRLVKYLHDRMSFDSAASVVQFLHQYRITYANCGEPFGTQMETKDPLSTYDIACICCQSCLKNNMPELAKYVTDHVKDLLKDDNGFYQLISHVIQGLLLKHPKNSFEMLKEFHGKIDKHIVEHLLNSLVLNLEKEKATMTISEADGFFARNPYSMYRETLKTFVNVYGRLGRIEDARRLYRQGVLLLFYERTFQKDHYTVEIPLGSRSTEIFLAIDNHIKELCEHPLEGVDGESLLFKTALNIVVMPKLEEDIDEDEFNRELMQTMSKVAHVLSKEFTPALQIISSDQQKYRIRPHSIVEYYQMVKSKQNSTHNTDHNSNNKLLTGFQVAPGDHPFNAESVRKRKRKINNGQEDNLLMTISTPNTAYPEIGHNNECMRYT